MEMEFPYVIVVGVSSGIVFASATTLIILNFRRIFRCCYERELKIETIVNPANSISEWK